LEAIEAEKIDYAVIGMSAAVAQGVMANTMDVDVWIDLAPRQYMRLLNLARGLGATIAANTVVYLEDGIPVNSFTRLPAWGRSQWRSDILQRLRFTRTVFRCSGWNES
jgi:hypothetical protein